MHIVIVISQRKDAMRIAYMHFITLSYRYIIYSRSAVLSSSN